MESDEICTYDMACARAELLGEELPDKDAFEKKFQEKLKIQQSELEAEEAKVLEAESEALNRTHGKLDEINTILSSTQKKLNDFKRTACGSLSNIFKGQSVDKSDPASVAGTSDNPPQTANDTETNTMPDDIQSTNLKAMKNQTMDINNKMTSHLDKLDSLINKAERADISMSAQTKQMKKLTK